ncbi:unnamed protein product [Orchesella dallaii]|uniref:Uncharacterized protein n=1 Tax=Orchesella dallaii TaxID=48710 RepID=A0ABP1RHX8_9HEXA
MDSHFRETAEPLKLAQNASTSHPQPNSGFQPDINSDKQNDKCCTFYYEVAKTPPQTARPEQDPPFPIPQKVNSQHQNDQESNQDFDYTSLLNNFNLLHQHSCNQDHLLRAKDTELNVFRENENDLKTRLGSLQQKCISQAQQSHSLRQEVQNLRNTTVSKEQYDEIVKQNKTIGDNNIKLSDKNDELLNEAKQVQLVKAEVSRLLLENEKLQQDHEDLNRKFTAEERKRIKIQTRWKELADFVLKLIGKIKGLDKSIEDHEIIVKTLEEELTGLKEGKKSQVEQLKSELAKEKAQISQLNSQLTISSEQLNLLSDHGQKLTAKMKQLNAEKESLKTKVSGLEEEKRALQNDIVDATSRTAELASECEQLKEKLETEKKRSSELYVTVQEQFETLEKLLTRHEEDKNELQRKSDSVSALENLLKKVDDDLKQEKTLVSRQKSQVEELELEINQAQEKNNELSVIIEGQEEKKDEQTMTIKQQKVLIASLQGEKLTLVKEVKEINKRMAEKDKIINGESFRVQQLSSQLQKHELDHVKLKMELDKEKTQNKQEILAEKSVSETLLREKAELISKFRSQSEIAETSSSIFSQPQNWEENKMILLRRNRALLKRETAKAAEVMELEHLVQKKLGELQQANEAIAALTMKISQMEIDSQACVIELCVELQRLQSNVEYLSRSVSQGNCNILEDVSNNELPPTADKHQPDRCDEHDDDDEFLRKRLRLE